MIRRPRPLPPTDDPYEIIRRAIGKALEVISPGRSVAHFDARRALYAAQRAVERLEKEYISRSSN